MLHPQERVVDEFQDGESSESGPRVNVVVHNHIAHSEVQVHDNGDELEIMIKSVENHLIHGVQTGGGPLSRAMERTYGMSRGGRR